jgi:hypothetical protein
MYYTNISSKPAQLQQRPVAAIAAAAAAARVVAVQAYHLISTMACLQLYMLYPVLFASLVYGTCAIWCAERWCDDSFQRYSLLRVEDCQESSLVHLLIVSINVYVVKR